MNSQESRQICVVLDTNVWVSNLMMRRGLGASLLYSLNRIGGYLGFPEVVEGEMAKHMVRLGLEANQIIENHFDTIGMLTGSKPRYPSLPTEEKFHSCVVDRLTELDKILKRTRKRSTWPQSGPHPLPETFWLSSSKKHYNLISVYQSDSV